MLKQWLNAEEFFRFWCPSINRVNFFSNDRLAFASLYIVWNILHRRLPSALFFLKQILHRLKKV